MKLIALPAWRRLVAVVLVILLGILGPLPSHTATTGGAPEDLTTDYLATFPANALVTAVLDDGQVEVRGHGVDAADRPVDGRTPFRIASMSKSFTATLVMVLAERGELDLDAPLTSVIPEFTMADDRAGRITLRMLLSHTSGIGGGSTTDLARPGSADPAVLLADLRDETLGSEPGREHVYVNTGYALAAVAVERVSGQTFDEALRTEVLEPLGMDRTVSVSDCAAPVDGVGSGHTVAFDRVLPYPEPADNCLGSGGVVSTADDVATWLQFQASGGRTDDGGRLLSDEGLRELHTVQPGTENVEGYGLGWSFGEAGDLDLLEHGGALVTWTSHMTLVRDADGRPTGDGAVVLTDTIGAPGMLARALAADAAGSAVPIPERSGPAPATVFGTLIVLVAAAGATGLVRSSSWPSRRRRPPSRTGGLAWPAAVALLCLAAPTLLATFAYGSPLGPVAAWRWGAGMLPEAMALIALTAAACLAVLTARLLALRAPGTRRGAPHTLSS